jgi:tRNA C32,U32 (ribose-2'-O)-methylase TrmJ
MLIKPKKTIFFLADASATEDEAATINAIGAGVVLRNAAFVSDDLSPGQIEDCDFVAGAVPALYAAKFFLWEGQPAIPAVPAASEIPEAPAVPAVEGGWGVPPVPAAPAE